LNTNQTVNPESETKDAIEDTEALQEMSDGEIMDGEEAADVIKMNKMRQMAEETLKAKTDDVGVEGGNDPEA